jgi:VWFA-related protein
MIMTDRRRRVVAGLAGALALAALMPAAPAGAPRPPALPQAAPPPQDPPPQRPIFRLGTDVVRIDVYPRARGQVVEGLTREEFQVFEDGVPQTIEAFEFIRLDDPTGESEALDPRDAREALRLAADPLNRVFVFFLDTYHVSWEGAARAREPILAFLREGLGPRDLFGVLTPQQAPELLTFGRATNDAASLMTLGRTWGLLDTPVMDPDEMLLQSCSMSSGRGASGLLALWRFDRTLSRLEELIVRLSALRQERKNIVLVSDGWPNAMFINRAPAPDAAGPAPRADAPAARGDQRGRGSFPAPSGLLPGNNVCSIEGSRLRGIDFRRRFQDLPDLARAANVALYVLTPGVRSLFNDPSGQFRGLAEDTDGLSIVSNDLAGSLTRMVDHQAGYYMLGYRSTSGPTDKRTRQIEVKTTRRDVDLELRREIYLPTPEDLAARGTGVAERTDVEKALDALERIRETTSLFVQVAPRGDRLEVTAEIASRLLAGGRWREGAAIEMTARDAAGAEIARAEGRLAPGARSARAVLPLPPGGVPARLAVRLRGSGGDLSDFVAVPPAGEAVLGAPLVSRAGSLPAMPFEPAAELQFQRTERVRVEWPVLAPFDEHHVRVVNAAGEDRVVDLVVTQVDAERPLLRADLRVLSLAPADYVLEATARAGETTGRHLLAFRVLR